MRRRTISIRICSDSVGIVVKEARAELTRLEERALDASSQRQRENLIRDTQQFVDAYAERGEAFRDLVADAQDLGVRSLQEAFDLTEQQRTVGEFSGWTCRLMC